MSKRTRVSLLVGILIIATFLRFYHLPSTPPGLYPDEAQDGVNAQNVAQTGQFKVYYPEDNGREGLYVNILAIAFKFHLLPDTAPWSVRFPAAVAGVLTVFGVYLLAAELFKERDEGYAVALLASFLLAVSFWHINFSRIGFRAILAPLLLVWSLYFFIKAVRAPASSLAVSWRAWLYATLAGGIYALGFYTYIAYRVTPLLFLLAIPFFHKQKDFWRRALIFVFVVALVAAPIGWYFAKHPADFFGRTSEISISNSVNPIHDLLVNVGKTALMFNVHGDYNWRQNISGAPQLFWPVGILFLFGILLGIIWLARRENDKNRPASLKNDELSLAKFGLWLTFGWFALGLLPEILSDEGIPHALRSLLVVIPAMLFAAFAGISLYRLFGRYGNKTAARVIGIIFLATVASYGYYDYFIVWAQNPNVPGAFSANYVDIGNAINALPVSTQKYVVVRAGGVTDYGIPVPAMTVMYITNSFVPDTAGQKLVKNIHYLLPDEINQIPLDTPSSTIFYIQ
jgi:4-amino-4-deoxy-L-arabinose transferase-like glycosyltransferase